MTGQLAGTVTVTVYSYKCWNDEAGLHVQMEPKATVDALVQMSGCTPIEGSGEEVPVSAVTVDGLYYPTVSITRDTT